MTIPERLTAIHTQIAKAQKNALFGQPVTLLAVSKGHGADAVRAAIGARQMIFAENRVQEAEEKFTGLRDEFSELELHLIGPLQSNKAKDAVRLFDMIHSIDRVSIAEKLANEMQKQNRALKFFIQVNTGEEPQKSGVLPRDLPELIVGCKKHGLEVIGLMCIPPVDAPPELHFAFLKKLADENDLTQLSMGMSDDFETAIRYGATHIRVGSAIFGARDYSGADNAL